MLRYTLKTIEQSISSLIKPSIPWNAPSSISLRVFPYDLDIYGHMNNGRYLTLMDMGRLDLVIRNGMGKFWLKKRWMPVLGGSTISYRRSLLLFQRYTLNTEMIYWDTRWFYMRQRFERHDGLYAVGLVKAMLLEEGATVAPIKMLQAMGKPSTPPTKPPCIDAWLSSESTMRGYPKDN